MTELRKLTILLAASSVTVVTVPPVAAQALPDEPLVMDARQTAEVADAIEPYVQQARKTYPDAKRGYLAGLPKGSRFYVTARLNDSAGHVEQVFIRVSGISDGRVAGTIASPVELLKGFSQGDTYNVAESDLTDWTIVDAEGNEVGNVVGRFLDAYQKSDAYAVIFDFVVDRTGHATRVRLVNVIDARSGSTEPADVPLTDQYLSAAQTIIAERTYDVPSNNGEAPELYSYLFFDPRHPTTVVLRKE